MSGCLQLARSLLLAAAVLAQGAFVVALAAEPERPNLKLLTWNIQMLPTGLSGVSEKLQKGQSLRAPWIVEYLNQHDYDIVVLQEVIDRNIAKQLQRGLEAHYPYLVFAAPKSGLAGCSGGVLFASRIPIKLAAHAVYENITGVDRLAEKGCLLVEGEHAGVRFQIAGTHLQAGDDATRDKEFLEIRDRIIVPHRKQGVPQILLGDMNVATTEPSFEALLEATEMRSFPLDDPHPFTIDGKNSWNRPNKRAKHIDHVLLNPRGTGTTIVRQTVQRARREHQGRTVDYADHYGVVAEVLLEK